VDPSKSNAPIVGDEISFSFRSDPVFSPGIESSENHTFHQDFGAFGNERKIKAFRTVTDVDTSIFADVQIQNLENKDLDLQQATVDLVNMRHTHEVSFGATTSQSAAGFEPGLVEQFPNDSRSNGSGEILASGVDVAVNGTVEASNIGSGEFTTTVDIGGALSPGTNDIEIRSDSLGFVSAFVETELFRRGRST
jgi:hypothetical protein